MDVTIPQVGESITEALVGRWLVRDGESVARNQPLCEIETDKITFELSAEADGVLSIRVAEGTTVPIGTVVGVIDEQASPKEAKPAAPAAAPAAEEKQAAPPVSPAVRKAAQERGISPESIEGTGRGGRVTMDDLLKEQGQRATEPQESTARPQPPAAPSPPPAGETTRPAGRPEERTPLSPIRKRIGERLVAARQQTAMLTTFNEVDMSRVMAMRKRHKEDFLRRHGVTLGFMPFFIRACTEALAEFPALNASIDGSDLVYHRFYDIGIAVSGEKGLVVPVLRDADGMHFADMERAIADFVDKVKTNRLQIADLEGGTFTITNGGVFGSLLSTPILNPPQSGVLGMHAIQERPVARDGQVVIRPMMYVALSYDHRIVDGRESVQFLKRVKELVEEPEDMLLES